MATEQQTPEQATSAAALVEAAIAETNRAREQEVARLRAENEALRNRVEKLKRHIAVLEGVRRLQVFRDVVRGHLSREGARLNEQDMVAQQYGLIYYAEQLYARWRERQEQHVLPQYENRDLEAPTLAVLEVAARHGNIAEPVREMLNTICPPPENG